MEFIIVAVLATILLAYWILLLMQADREVIREAAINKVIENQQKADKLRKKDSARKEQLDSYSGFLRKFMSLFLGGDSEKECRKLERENEKIKDGAVNRVNALELPGYVLLRKKDFLARGRLHKAIYATSQELYGKKYAENITRHTIAKMFSYGLAGIPVVLLFGIIIGCFRGTTVGLAVTGVGLLLLGVLIYAIYDEMKDNLNKRRAAIARQFPNVVSKLALLVSSGMIMERAWRVTAESRTEELYMEMRQTAQELDNLQEPSIAYTDFLNRCNTKETTKLASAVIQNQSKSNAEIGHLLKSMAQEAWLERRHTAKRESEKANSRLMIPTMLLFVAILIMIMIPVISNFQLF